MISFSPINALTRAQTSFEGAARKIAQSGPTPEDSIQLVSSKEQFSAGVKLSQTQDEMSKKLLDIFA